MITPFTILTTLSHLKFHSLYFPEIQQRSFLDMHDYKNCSVSSRNFYVQLDFTVSSLMTRPCLYVETKRFPY